jgi:hypothetical protein
MLEKRIRELRYFRNFIPRFLVTGPLDKRSNSTGNEKGDKTVVGSTM